MNTLEVKLPNSVRDFLDDEVAAKGYKSPSQYLTALLRALQRRRAWDNLEALVLEGLATPARPMTKSDWQRLRARVIGGNATKKKK